MAVEHGMDGAFRWELNHGERSGQLLPDLGCPPGGVFLLDPEDGALDLEGNHVGVTIGSPAAILEALQTQGFAPIEYFVSGGS